MTQLPFLRSDRAAGSYHILAGGANSSLEIFFTFFLFPVTFSQSGELSCPCIRVDDGGVAPWRDKNINDDGSFRCNPTYIVIGTIYTYHMTEQSLFRSSPPPKAIKRKAGRKKTMPPTQTGEMTKTSIGVSLVSIRLVIFRPEKQFVSVSVALRFTDWVVNCAPD